MKENSVFEKLMHFLIHNSFLVTVTVMGLVHATLLAIVILAGVRPLISMNILSVVVYLFCIVLAKFGHMLPVYLSLIVEVTSYAIVSTYYTGWECGSWCFLFSIVPIIIYFGAFLFKGNQRWFIVLMLVVNFAVYVVLYLRFDGEEALFRVTPLIRDILILFSSFMMVFATIFYSMIYIYASEMEKTSLEKKNEKLTAEISKLTDKKLFVDIKEIKRPDRDAQLVAENIAQQLENRVSFRRAMKSTMQRTMKAGALGIKASCGGRLGGADIARTEFYSEGTIPLQTLRADIDYGFAEADTQYGKVGVKVWIYKGEILPTKNTKEGSSK